MKQRQKIGIVGAGIAGIIAARTLTDAGHEITLFEKSKGIGGRLSTRRTQFGSFDHGAQYITAKGKAFRGLMTGLANKQTVSFWEPNGKDRSGEWHVGLPGMSGLLKPHLNDVDLRKATHIEKISSTNSDIHCVDTHGNEYQFDIVIVTTPSPQAAKLLKPVDPIFSVLDDVVYMPCWTSMFAFENKIETLADIYRGNDKQPISWLARNNSKPNRSGTELICVQAGALWSRDNLNINKSIALEHMHNTLQDMAGFALKPVYAEAHRWLYARVDKPLGMPYLASDNNKLYCIGDGMLGGRVEAAFESSRQLCDHLKTII